VGALIKKLRAMHGHLSAKDRAVAVECIGALTDLSVQLWHARHPETVIEDRRGGCSLRKVLESDDVRDALDLPTTISRRRTGRSRWSVSGR